MTQLSWGELPGEKHLMSQGKNVVVSSSYTFEDISFHLTTCHYKKLKWLFELIVSLYYYFTVTSKNTFPLASVYIHNVIRSAFHMVNTAVFTGNSSTQKSSQMGHCPRRYEYSDRGDSLIIQPLKYPTFSFIRQAHETCRYQCHSTIYSTNAQWEIKK